jgi:hypothetical protein
MNLYTFIFNLKLNYKEDYNKLLNLIRDEIAKNTNNSLVPALYRVEFTPSQITGLDFIMPVKGLIFNITDTDRVHTRNDNLVNIDNIIDILTTFKQSHDRKRKIEEICK